VLQWANPEVHLLDCQTRTHLEVLELVGTAAVEVEVMEVIAATVGAVLEEEVVSWGLEVAAVAAQLQAVLVEVVGHGASRVLLQPLGGLPGFCSEISLLR
jgi:hypothetical protein